MNQTPSNQLAAIVGQTGIAPIDTAFSRVQSALQGGLLAFATIMMLIAMAYGIASVSNPSYRGRAIAGGLAAAVFYALGLASGQLVTVFT